MAGQINNYRRFYAVFQKYSHPNGIEEDKAAVVSSFTQGRTAHLSEMKQQEYAAMCKTLEGQLGYTDQRKKQRSICLHLMQGLGIDTHDWSRINDFCRNPRIAGKPFADITLDELKALANKLRAIERSGGLKKSEEGREKREESNTQSNQQHQQIVLMNYGNNIKPS